MNIYVFQYGTDDYQPSETGVKIIVYPDTPLVHVVTLISDLAPAGPSIECLHLCAHGNAGWVNIGSPAGLAAENAYCFEAIRGRFQPEGRGILIHACLVASAEPRSTCDQYEHYPGVVRKNPNYQPGKFQRNGKGHNFIKTLAYWAQTKVTAALNCQGTDRIEGIVMVAHPDKPVAVGGRER